MGTYSPWKSLDESSRKAGRYCFLIRSVSGIAGAISVILESCRIISNNAGFRAKVDGEEEEERMRIRRRGRRAQYKTVDLPEVEGQ